VKDADMRNILNLKFAVEIQKELGIK